MCSKKKLLWLITSLSEQPVKTAKNEDVQVRKKKCELWGRGDALVFRIPRLVKEIRLKEIRQFTHTH